MKPTIKFCLLIALMLAGCRHNDPESSVSSSEPLDSLAPELSYGDCVRRLAARPQEDGFIYHVAFYKAVDADTLQHYKSFLDSLMNNCDVGPNVHYVVAHRLISAYLLSSDDFDTLKVMALTMKPSIDITQEEVFAHVTAKALLATDNPHAMDMQMRALSAMRHGGVYRSAEVLSQAALICCNLGRYPTAMDYLNEAADTLERRGWPSREAVFMLGNKASLYQTLEMTDSALSVNKQALQRATGNASLTADLLKTRALIYAKADCRDSAKIFFDSTLSVVSKLEVPYGPMFTRYVRAQRARIVVDEPASDAAQLREAVACLEASLRDKIGSWEECFSLALGQFRLGDASATERMKTAHDSIEVYLEPRTVLWAKRHLIAAYTACGNRDAAAAEYDAAFALADTVDMRHARYMSIAGDMKYHIRQQTRENELLRRTHSTDRAKVFWLTVACLLGVALLIWAGFFIFLNNRFRRRRRVADSREMTTLIENHKMLNRRIESLQNSGEGTVDWSKLTPSSMSAEDTARFRQSFTALYPLFLTRLREFCPGLTTGDETMCMLIKIGQSSVDIGLALGISRASVNTARYRIRKKMELSKEQQLDDIIMRM